MKIIFFIVVQFCMFCASCGAFAADIREVISVGPNWETFTNRDGSGLYHEILREVFKLHGVTVRHEYVPSDRGDELVREGVADMMICDDRAAESLVLARYPMYVSDYFVFFKKSRIGRWKGPESLKNKEIVCQKGYYHDWDFPVPVRLRSMPSGANALNMIIMDRSDFYVDDLTFIEISIKEAGKIYDPEKYDIRKAGNRSYHPLFMTSERGLAVMQMFNDGILQLHQEDQLRPIYEKWGYQYPDFDNF
ncbi:substrate-binding periplasmic protein [Pseudodesulfovibrio sediminis]|nr:transporter substrate-binding domain-containing protein [Pseudodesulfovibrio sediminis]